MQHNVTIAIFLKAVRYLLITHKLLNVIVYYFQSTILILNNTFSLMMRM